MLECYVHRHIYICHDQVNVAKMLKKASNIIHLIHGLEGENQSVVLRYGEKPWNWYPRLKTEGNKSTGLLPILRDN